MSKFICGTSTSIPDSKAIHRRCHLFDVDGRILGRFATKIAEILRGKHKPEYTPHMDMGDYVVVINASKVRVTGNKFKDKVYETYSGYPGGYKTKAFADLLSKFPERIIRHAVKGMLPKGPLGNSMIKKLKIFSGATHKHKAQSPVPFNLKDK